MMIKICPGNINDESAEDAYLKVAKALSRSNRCMVVTGAGISCSAGIPDFRSKGGLYDMLKSKNPNAFVKGQDLFDANLFRSAETTGIFYRFIGEFKDMIGNCKYTKTHGFIKRLHDFNKLLRCYTQNIDDLEVGLTLKTELCPDPQQAQVVQLHGSMSHVVCTLAPNLHKFEFSSEYVTNFKSGEPPTCPSCKEFSRERSEKGKRSVQQGVLRPDIVLYNEHHPLGELIGNLQEKDLKKRPDFLLIMGTSLKIPGCKRLIKEAAKVVHSFKNGIVAFVNLGDVSISEWEGIVDYHFQCTTDGWVNKIEPLFLSYCNARNLRRSASASAAITKSKTSSQFSIRDAINQTHSSSSTDNDEPNNPIKPLSRSNSIKSQNSRVSKQSHRINLIKSSSAIPGQLNQDEFDNIMINDFDDFDFEEPEELDSIDLVSNANISRFSRKNSVLSTKINRKNKFEHNNHSIKSMKLDQINRTNSKRNFKDNLSSITEISDPFEKSSNIINEKDEPKETSKNISLFDDTKLSIKLPLKSSLSQNRYNLRSRAIKKNDSFENLDSNKRLKSSKNEKSSKSEADSGLTNSKITFEHIRSPLTNFESRLPKQNDCISLSSNDKLNQIDEFIDFIEDSEDIDIEF